MSQTRLPPAAATVAPVEAFPADMIRRVTESNRAARDAHLEEELVVLRHEAFATIERAAPPDRLAISAVPVNDAPLPEFAARDVTPTLVRSEFARHGCVLIRGLISADHAAALTEGIDRALAAFDAGLDGAPKTETSPWYAPFTPTAGKYRIGGRRNWMRASGGMWTVDSPRMLFELLELLEDTGIGELVGEYFGEQPALSANKCNLRRVPVTTATNWHQDGAFLGNEVCSANFWLCLSHCGVDAPGLDFVPRRLDELLETGTDGAIFDWSVSPAIVDRLDAPVIRPQLAPGDALLFDHMFLHRTGVSPGMTRERYAIETWFFAPSSYPEGQIPIVY